MKLVFVSGTRGSGKTTLIKGLVARGADAGLRSAVICNEDGEAVYDAPFVEAHDLPVRYLRGGCVGCTLAVSLVEMKKRLKKEHDPDLLFVEPSEMVVTRELRDVAAMGTRDIRYEPGPFLTLVDGPSFPFLWEERQRLLKGHMAGADLVAVTHARRMGDGETGAVLQAIKGNGVEPIAVDLGSEKEVARIGELALPQGTGSRF